jgi:ubiquitin carboxyl-terminal hydrolase MINDY-1/2
VICNILILREQIVIPPGERKTISYESLGFLVLDYIAKTKNDVDVTEMLHMMSPSTSESCTRAHCIHCGPGSRTLTLAGAMSFNPVFTSITFRPIGDELRLFETTGIPLVHGWLVDPASPEYAAVGRVENYESAQNLMVDAACLIQDSNPAGAAGPSRPNINLTEEEKEKYNDGVYNLGIMVLMASRLTRDGTGSSCHDPKVSEQLPLTAHVPWPEPPCFLPSADVFYIAQPSFH